MAGRGNAGRGVLKQALKDLETRVTNTEHRLDRVETTVELSESYRRLRVEHSEKLSALWAQFERKEVEGKDLRRLATEALTQEIKEMLGKEYDEAALHSKSSELSNGRRTLPAVQIRRQMANDFAFDNLVEWITKDRAGGFQVILQRGEPTRLFTEGVRTQLNWSLYVLSKMSDPPSGIQVYLDRGPKQRSKGKGKAGPGKGKGKGHGKGRGNAKGGKGRGKGKQRNADEMDT